jgi:hypothetical protein
VRVFKTKWFARFAKREGIADRSLIEAIKRAERGLVDADLGGGLIKQRIARPGKGRSGGYRVVIGYRKGHRAVFIYGLAKSDRANFRNDELDTARDIGSMWIFALSEQITRGLREGELVEVEDGNEETE